jgi:hypothetical protein
MQKFKEGTCRREQRPLPSGRYKLEKLQSSLDRMTETVNAYLNADKEHPPSTLGGCLLCEAPAYINECPGKLAFQLGYNFLPAVAALEGDEVPKAEVQTLHSFYMAETEMILSHCERVARLRGRKAKAVLGLLEDARAVVSHALQL